MVLGVFSAIALTLTVHFWVPAKSGLQQTQARIVSIEPLPATRYNAIFITEKGRRLSCVEKGLRDWPPAPLNRYPIEVFAAHLGQTVTVLHDGHAVYEVRLGKQTLLSYSAFRRVQGIMLIVALILMVVSIHFWRTGKA